jgi:hypothetical protein
MLELITLSNEFVFVKCPSPRQKAGQGTEWIGSGEKGKGGCLYQEQETETNQVDDTSQVTNSYGKSTNRGALRSAIQSRELWSTAR